MGRRDHPTRPTSERSLRRVLAEQAWLAFGAETGRRVEVFRLAGIYGPGRSVIDNLRAGTARRIVKPGQVFNRIHVDDIARVLAAAIERPPATPSTTSADDEPAPPQDVVAYAAELLGVPAARHPVRAGRPQRHGRQLLGREQARQQRPHQARARRDARLPDLPRGLAGDRGGWVIETPELSRFSGSSLRCTTGTILRLTSTQIRRARAKFSIETGKIIEGRLPRRPRQEWDALHVGELAVAWQLVEARQVPAKIDPLE